MKRLYIIYFLILGISVQAQYSTINNHKFDQIVKQTETRYNNKYKGRGSGYKQFKRWEDFVQKRLDENGNRINSTAMAFAAFDSMKKAGKVVNTRSNGYWTELGPNSWSNNPDPYPSTHQGGWNPGNGRINEIAFHPTNPNIIYAGASGGGLWRTSDGGLSWTSLTDGMPNLAISGIAVSHTNPDIIYILTGDGDSRDLASIGVLKSTDAGVTWFITDLTFASDQLKFGYELKMDPTNSDILLATTNDGIYRTDDAGTIWTKVSNSSYYDIEYMPSNGDTIYVSGSTKIYRSVDGGFFWNEVQDLSGFAVGSSRIELAVTDINTQKVVAVMGDKEDGYKGLWVSNDSGGNWVRNFDPNGPNIMGYDEHGDDDKSQVTYDLAIDISKTNENVVFVGGINIWRTIDEGDNWSISSHWRQDWDSLEYVHADIHELIFNGSTLYTGSDGGIFKTTNSGTDWVDISEGLGIMQPHKIGISQSNTSLAYLGTQDNGVNKYSGTSTFDNVRGADGFECIILPIDNNTVFTSRQYGITEKSTDGGVTFSGIIGSSSYKLFNNPLLLRPILQDRLIVSDSNAVILHNLSGTLIDSLPIPQSGGSVISNLSISQADDDVLVASIYGSSSDGSSDSLWITTNLFDASPTWTNITTNLPVQSGYISDIVIDPSNNNHLIVSFQKYIDGNKVFETWNGGTSWNNISYDLENIPVNCLAIDSDVFGSIYIGTDLGVFYKAFGETEWAYYSNGLPTVIVNELEINTTSNYLYAATYGRGLWRSSLYTDCTNAYNLTPGNDPSNPDYTGVQHYEASTSIASTRIITGGYGTNVHYQAGTYIDLTPGFIVTSGSVFRSVIGQCGEVVNDIIIPETNKTKEILIDE